MKKPPVRRKRSAARRLRPFWIAILLLAALAAAGGYYAAAWPGFYPRHVGVSGNVTVPTQEVLRRAAVPSHANVWLLNTRAACERVEAIAYVAGCAIHRSLPAGINVQIVERRPFANVTNARQAVLVDERLRVLEPAPRAGYPKFVRAAAHVPGPGAFVRDPDIVRLRDDYMQMTAAHVFARSLRLDAFAQLDATLDDGIDVYFGDERNLARTLPLVNPIVSQVASRGRPVRAIDLRAPGTPVVVYRK